ncbi:MULTISPECIES: prepilin peptidase-dependent protein [unclassified Gilliamella]|uniref:prepilin peptidase-dependent protein n=1 Tax=unclassified Gilliamella TaxID=2685620 RepID=UPI0013223641|nr:MULTISPECIES: prepilin peptidase-dependent protein [unclassified Gilliamella]MWN31655.1 prepilin peptidase-dependent protein [Gilliamella sp. Pra-s60]MWP28762.1 prepilin peptidase-dependent protein [Gilliamella sp. Pra-s54]
MLKIAGFSLFEMLISIILSSLIIMGMTSFYIQLQTNIMQYYQKTRLQQAIDLGLAGMKKDIKRAGFIANDPQKMTTKAIEINERMKCIILRYDSEIRNSWVWNIENPMKSDVFTYRYKENNIAYRTGSLNCFGNKWENLFDSNEIKITYFAIKQLPDAIRLSITAELIKNKQIKYHTTEIIKNENRF